MEPENREDKYAVAVIDRESRIVGHLPKGTSGKYAKTVFFFLRADALNICSVEVTAKAVNLGDGKGMSPLQINLQGKRYDGETVERYNL